MTITFRRMHLRTSFVVLAWAVAATVGVWCARPAAALAAPVHLSTTWTDNYKAAYNADPSQRERRTWLVIGEVRASGLRYRPPRPTSIIVTDGGTTEVRAPTGAAATLRVRALDAHLGVPVIRIDPDGLWGVLVAVPDPNELVGAPARLQVDVLRGSRVLGSSVVTYRHDAALAAAPSSNIEWNGPAGRWWLASTPTKLNWQGGSTADYAAPWIAAARFVRTASLGRRLAIAAQDDGTVTHVRTRKPGGRFGAWRALRGASIAAGSVTVVDVQVRDRAGRASRVVRVASV